MQIEASTLEAQVTEIIRYNSSLPNWKFDKDAIVADVVTDSLDRVETFMSFEEEFNIEIPDDDIHGKGKVKGLSRQSISVLMDYLREKIK